VTNPGKTPPEANRDTIAERFHYLRPIAPLGTGIHLGDLHKVLDGFAPTLAVDPGRPATVSGARITPGWVPSCTNCCSS
jgi:hypothetical protein